MSLTHYFDRTSSVDRFFDEVFSLDPRTYRQDPPVGRVLSR